MFEVKKAVIPVAGFGTRFMPYTKAVPKAMLPILNIPAIQIITEEVIKSGIEEVLFVVGYKHEVIRAHFSKSEILDEELLAKNKMEFYNAVKYPETMAKFSFVEQKELNGTAKAIEIAKESERAIIDIETSGIFCGEDGKEPASILRVDGVKIEHGEIVGNFSSLVACDKIIPKHIEKITGISNLTLSGAPNVKTVLKNLKEFTSGYEVYARNSKFDNKFLTYYGNKFEEEVNLLEK